MTSVNVVTETATPNFNKKYMKQMLTTSVIHMIIYPRDSQFGRIFWSFPAGLRMILKKGQFEDDSEEKRKTQPMIIMVACSSPFQHATLA